VTHDNQRSRVERRAEKRYQISVQRDLTRNFTAHLLHGMLGQTGFRLLNAPTFLPAFILLISGGSDTAVGAAMALQSFGMMLTPLLGASIIEHREKVLPVGFVTGTAMRLCVLAIAAAGFFLAPGPALAAIFVALLVYGLMQGMQGMQGVIFNFLMSKVIPVSKRGRLTGMRNFLAGIISAIVAFLGGEYFLGDEPTISGYSAIFLLAFVLTSAGLTMLVMMRESVPPRLRKQAPFFRRLREVPQLLRDEPEFARYVLARSIATTGRLAMPFYVLYVARNVRLTGENLALLTIAFTVAATISNLVWGAIADRGGFRNVFLIASGLWVVATMALLGSEHLIPTLVVFASIGAAAQGFQNACVNLTLEFGQRHDLPLRIALANSSSELAGTLGLLAGGVTVLLAVRDPRHQNQEVSLG
jgi:MFS family permease